MSRSAIGLAVLRHGPTEWNSARRLQGRTDIPLSPDGRDAVGAWRLPELAGTDWRRWRSYTSPLSRCRETAEIMLRSMNLPEAEADDRLVERGFGAWEGETLAGLRARYGERMAQWEAQGWDFRPPGGESPREVLQRSMVFLQDMLQQGRSIVTVTHRSVIRAWYGEATGWDMLGPPPEKLGDGRLHLFRLSAAGLSVDRLNIPLAP